MANPYELWQTHTLLGVMRDVKVEEWYFGQYFTNGMTFEDEYVDLEKLPILSRKLAPFVRPLGRGRSVYSDSQRTMRFKPAYIIVEEDISPLDGLSFVAGIDRSMLAGTKPLGVMQRRALLKAAKTAAALKSVERRWEWMRARAIIDGKITVTYDSGESVLVDFQRAAGHTEVLTSGNRFGDSGVSILDYIQATIDTMNNAEFGGMPTRITMGGNVASIVRKDAEILQHLDKNIVGGSVVVDRGVVSGVANGGQVYKFGELTVGGASGQRIELWVNNATYTDNSGNQQRYLATNQMLFTGTPESIMGYECFGRIIDQDANFAALPIFPKNFTTGDDVKVEHVSLKSAPLMVPINPNATFLSTPIA